LQDTPTLKVRAGVQKKLPGFQAQLVCLTPWNNGESPSHITALTINSSYGLMAYGNEAGIVIIDIEQKVCLLNVGSPDLYGAQDPYSRVPRSPKKGAASVADILPMNMDREERQPRSPSIDQVSIRKINLSPSRRTHWHDGTTSVTFLPSHVPHSDYY
jgi:syntaxin-binding protein 5